MASFIQKAKTLKPQGIGLVVQPREAMQQPTMDQGAIPSPVPLAKINRPQELPKVAAPQTAQQNGDIIPTPPWSSQPLPASSPQAPFISDQAPQRQADTSQIDLKNLIRATLAEVMGTSGTQPMQNSALLQPPVQTEALDQLTDVAREDPDFQFKQSFTPAEERPAELTQEEVLRPRARPTESSSSDFEQALIERLIGLEQFKDTAYRATKDEKHLTIGYGHYGPDVKENQKITQEDALNLLRSDIAERLPAIKKAIPVFDELSLPLQVEIAQSWFRGGMSGSPKTIGLINEGKFAEASREFLDNKEYKTARERGRAGVIPRMEAVSIALLKEESK